MNQLVQYRFNNGLYSSNLDGWFSSAKAARSSARSIPIFLPQRPRQLNLRGQRVQVDQNKARQFVRVDGLGLADAVDVMQCFVAKDTQAVRPFFHGRYQPSRSGQMGNPRIERFVDFFRGLFLGDNFQCAPVHGGSRIFKFEREIVPVDKPKRVFCLHKGLRHRLGEVVGNINGSGIREKRHAQHLITLAKVACDFGRFDRILNRHPDRDGLCAGIALKQRIPDPGTIGAVIELGTADPIKRNVLRKTVWAVSDKGRRHGHS